jgi:hypothetical protein
MTTERQRIARYLLGALLAVALLLLWFPGVLAPSREGALGAIVAVVRDPPVASAILLCLSFAGWGSLLNRLVLPGRRVDLGLRCVWGMASLAVLGGPLVLLHLAVRPLLIAIVGLGVLVFGLDACARRAPRRAARMDESDVLFAIGTVLVTSVLVLRLVGEAGRVVVYPNDDAPAYWVFIQEILQTGGSDQPFSLRRLMLYGGQPFQQALLAARGHVEHVSVFDRGICPLLAGLLVVGTPVPRGIPRGVLLAPLLLVAFASPVWNNSASYFSGVAMLFGLYRTMTLWPAQSRVRIPAATCIALVAVAAWSLRPNYGFGAALTIGGGYVPRLLARRRQRRPIHRVLREAGLILGLSLLFVAPWALGSLLTFRTPLFPALYGTYAAGSAGFGAGTPFYWRFYYALVPFFETRVPALWLFLVAAFTLRDRCPRRPLHPMVIGALFVAILFSVVLHEETARYTFANEFAAVLAIATAAASRGWRPFDMQVGAPLAAMAVFAQIAETRSPAEGAYKGYLEDIRERMHTPRPVDPPAAEDARYARLQAAVPDGKRVLVMVDEPYRFDFARNPVFIIDYPGLVSPRPGIPLFGGPEAVAMYLLGLGIRYAIVLDDGGERLYSHHGGPNGGWVAVTGDPGVDPSAANKPYFLAALDDFKRLTESRRTIFVESGVRVLDLATPR